MGGELLVQPYPPPLLSPPKIGQNIFGQDDRRRWAVPSVFPLEQFVGRILRKQDNSKGSGWTGWRSTHSLYGSNTSFGKTLKRQRCYQHFSAGALNTFKCCKRGLKVPCRTILTTCYFRQVCRRAGLLCDAEKYDFDSIDRSSDQI